MSEKRKKITVKATRRVSSHKHLASIIGAHTAGNYYSNTTFAVPIDTVDSWAEIMTMAMKQMTKQITEILAELRKEWTTVTSANLRVVSSNRKKYLELHITGTRPETDAEYKARIDKEEKARQAKLQRLEQQKRKHKKLFEELDKIL